MPVDLPPGASQSFLIAVTPFGPLSPIDVRFDIDGTNTTRDARTVIGLNTLLLSSSTQATPDIVALAATPESNGILTLTGSPMPGRVIVEPRAEGGQGDSAVARPGVEKLEPQPLGRPLTGANVVTVNLIQPYTMFADRRNSLDFRAAKILRLGGRRAQVGVDLYNLMNVDVVTAYNQTFVPGGAWLTPTALQPARYARFSMQIDF